MPHLPFKEDAYRIITKEINKRKEVGYIEMDCVVVPQGSEAALIALTEGVTRFEVLPLLPHKTQEDVKKALSRLKRRLGVDEF